MQLRKRTRTIQSPQPTLRGGLATVRDVVQKFTVDTGSLEKTAVLGYYRTAEAPQTQALGLDTLEDEDTSSVDVDVSEEQKLLDLVREMIARERKRIIQEAHQATEAAKAELRRAIADTKGERLPVVEPLALLRRRDFPDSRVPQAVLDGLYQAARAAVQPRRESYYEECWRQAVVKERLFTVSPDGSLKRVPGHQARGTRLRRAQRTAKALFKAEVEKESAPGYAGPWQVLPDPSAGRELLLARAKFERDLAKYIDGENADRLAKRERQQALRRDAIKARRERLNALYQALNNVPRVPIHFDALDALWIAALKSFQRIAAERREAELSKEDRVLSRNAFVYNERTVSEMHGDNPLGVTLDIENETVRVSLAKNSRAEKSFVTVRIDEEDKAYFEALYTDPSWNDYTGTTAAAVGRALQTMNMEPVKPGDINLLSELLELKDVPATVKNIGQFFRWARTSFSARKLSKVAVSDVATAYLTYEYGVEPTVDFVRAFCNQIGDFRDWVAALFDPSQFAGTFKMRRRATTRNDQLAGSPATTYVRAEARVSCECIVPLTRDEDLLPWQRVRTDLLRGRQLYLFHDNLNAYPVFGSDQRIDEISFPSGKWNGRRALPFNSWAYPLTSGSALFPHLLYDKAPTQFEAWEHSRRITLWSDLSGNVDPQDAIRHFAARNLLQHNAVLEAGWNIVPFSFMADWFLGISSFLREANGFVITQLWSSDLDHVWVTDRGKRRHLIASPTVLVGRPEVRGTSWVETRASVGRLQVDLAIPYQIFWRWGVNVKNIYVGRHELAHPGWYLTRSLKEGFEHAFEIGRKRVDPWKILPQALALGVGTLPRGRGIQLRNVLRDLTSSELKSGRKAARTFTATEALAREVMEALGNQVKFDDSVVETLARCAREAKPNP